MFLVVVTLECLSQREHVSEAVRCLGSVFFPLVAMCLDPTRAGAGTRRPLISVFSLVKRFTNLIYYKLAGQNVIMLLQNLKCILKRDVCVLTQTNK